MEHLVVGTESHATEGGVVGGITAVVHAVWLGRSKVLEEVDVAARNNLGITAGETVVLNGDGEITRSEELLDAELLDRDGPHDTAVGKSDRKEGAPLGVLSSEGDDGSDHAHCSNSGDGSVDHLPKK